MAIPAMPDRRTQAEKDAYERRSYEMMWFEPGRTYTYDMSSHWVSGWGFYRRENWTVYIRQAECPWSLLTIETFGYVRTLLSIYKLVQRIRANRWAKAYLKRGGPPLDHWAVQRYRTVGTRG